jgi:hypothetical protein
MAKEREPSLYAILSEPIVRQLMSADGVSVSDIWSLFHSQNTNTEFVSSPLCARLRGSKRSDLMLGNGTTTAQPMMCQPR